MFTYAVIRSPPCRSIISNFIGWDAIPTNCTYIQGGKKCIILMMDTLLN